MKLKFALFCSPWDTLLHGTGTCIYTDCKNTLFISLPEFTLFTTFPLCSLVVDGMQVTADEFTGGDTILDEMEIEALLNSIAYIAREHPGFNRR